MNNTLEKFAPEMTHRQFSLSPVIAAKTISEICGKSEGASGDGKVKNEWNVREISTGEVLSIWDYRGAKWSCFGSVELARRLFGAENVLP